MLHDPRSVAALIDHTILKPEALRADVEKLCREALEFHFASVCVNPHFVGLVSKNLQDSQVKTCAVVGFPLGANLTATKLFEAQAAISEGATEIDMVIPVGALKSGELSAVRDDIASVAAACHAASAICKVIIETCLLTDTEKITVCRIAAEAGADFVKTSTGFASAGANPQDVALMRSTVGPNIGVKASGGIRTLDDLLKMVDAGANRIGASAGVKIIEEARARWAP